MKKDTFPNQGHLVPDYFVDSINRIYIEENSLMIVFATPTGIEDAKCNYKNECLRLIIPLSKANFLLNNINEAFEELEINKNLSKEEVKSSKNNITNEQHGTPFITN